MSSTTQTEHSFSEAPSRFNNFFRFIAYVGPYKWDIVAATLGGIVKFTLPLFIPQITRYLLDDVFLNPALNTDQKLAQLLLNVGGLILAFVFIWSPFTYFRHYLASRASYHAVFDLRVELYYRILRMSASFFDRNMSGSIVSRLIGDIELAQNLVGSALTDTWMDFIALAAIIFFLLQIDVTVTLSALVTFPLYLYFFRKSQSNIRVSSLRVQEEIAAMSGHVQERIAGNRVVHAFTQEKTEENSFLRDSQSLFSTTMWRAYLQSMNITTTGVLTQIAPLIVLLYGGTRVVSGQLTVGELVAVTMYLTPLYTPMQRFAQLNLVFANSMAAVDRVFEIMDEKPEIRDRPGAAVLNDVVGTVEFEHVGFAYPQATIAEPGPVLRNISFVVEPGERVALVGHSGSGKSTVVSLIPRFYDVDQGRVLIDGQDVRDITVNSLRRNVGMVLQNPILFSGSILDNIRYGRPDATMADVVEACKAANAYDFISKLPKQFDSEVGEGGNFLSGGQKQRVTIARAFLKNPKILILDEATSALDSVSERLVQQALERLMQGRTTFIIAHRLSTIENADRIFVLEQGRVVESGTHDELLGHTGVYHKLYS
ncbi:MAG: ABC transporter ATP-binding protein/permease [Chloroflexi bacterium]|nr:ABC transporter ATP-binding protein/permease [Chloroflexota bacterium]MCC6894869.1 ABC transporter ATP-binding protein [Anaerolineae bacterium]